MRLQDIQFGPVWAASGALGFFKDGYWFHHNPLLSPDGMTFVAKTTTTYRIIGNMPIDPVTWRPRAWFPKCIWWNFARGIAMNSVGLTNFGIKLALRTGRWQGLTSPFMLSYMSMGDSEDDRIQDARQYVVILKPELKNFDAPVALQVNLSCPNTGDNLKKLTLEAVGILRILKELMIPLVPKFNVLTSPEMVEHIAERVVIDAVCVSNAIPYYELRNQIDWAKLVGDFSPLEQFGGGALSGNAISPLVMKWLQEAQRIGLSVPINACGGIMSIEQSQRARALGAKSISLATVLMLRPWRVRGIIHDAHRS